MQISKEDRKRGHISEEVSSLVPPSPALGNVDPELGCALTFASEARFEIEAKISFRLEAKKA